MVSGATVARSKGLDKGFFEYDDTLGKSRKSLEGNHYIAERIAENSVNVAINQMDRFKENRISHFFYGYIYLIHMPNTILRNHLKNNLNILMMQKLLILIFVWENYFLN